VLQLPPAHPEHFEPAPAVLPLLPLPERTAKEDICFSRSVDLHAGHCGLSLPKTRVSNSLPQDLQIKSNNGMFIPA
jgi:hypothetical protein